MCFVLFEINDNNFYTEQTLFIRKKPHNIAEKVQMEMKT